MNNLDKKLNKFIKILIVYSVLSLLLLFITYLLVKLYVYLIDNFIEPNFIETVSTVMFIVILYIAIGAIINSLISIIFIRIMQKFIHDVYDGVSLFNLLTGLYTGIITMTNFARVYLENHDEKLKIDLIVFMDSFNSYAFIGFLVFVIMGLSLNYAKTKHESKEKNKKEELNYYIYKSIKINNRHKVCYESKSKNYATVKRDFINSK